MSGRLAALWSVAILSTNSSNGASTLIFNGPIDTSFVHILCKMAPKSVSVRFSHRFARAGPFRT